MAEKDKRVDKRPWYALSRVQGVLLMAAGVAMCFHPATAPYAGTVITTGAGWAAGGTVSAVARKVFNGVKPKPGADVPPAVRPL